jgi:hypothetical protein
VGRQPHPDLVAVPAIISSATTVCRRPDGVQPAFRASKPLIHC